MAHLANLAALGRVVDQINVIPHVVGVGVVAVGVGGAILSDAVVKPILKDSKRLIPWFRGEYHAPGVRRDPTAHGPAARAGTSPRARPALARDASHLVAPLLGLVALFFALSLRTPPV